MSTTDGTPPPDSTKPAGAPSPEPADGNKPAEPAKLPPVREATVPFLLKADEDGKFNLKRTQIPLSKPAAVSIKPKASEQKPETKADPSAPTPLPGSLVVPPDAPSAPADSGPWMGREQTLIGAPKPAPAAPPPAADQGAWMGREATIVGPAPTAEPKPEAWMGRESTMVGMPAPAAAPMTDQAGAPWMGREATVIGPAPGQPAGTSVPTDPKKLGKTTATMDDAWHLNGRKGPFTGQVWGDFELGGILGEGGMGAVYRAKQVSLRRRVAIKVLPPNLSADTRLLQRFQLEATTASKLQTPHVVQVYAIGEHEGNHFYAMEFVEGKDLYDTIQERRAANQPLTPDEACNYILQAAKGLAEAGRQNIVHRDIKPPNLLITKAGLVKIADFGIVKVLGEHQLTMTGQAVGTPAYVSPEQGRGDSDVDPRSDLYSLGVVFYELACDKKPFDGTTANALIYQHCYEEPKLPREINPAISEEVQAVILRCLQKKPENRYQSADDLVRDLEAIRTGTMLKSAIANYKLGTGADEAKREQMTWLQRNMLPIAAAALLVIGSGAALAYWYIDKKNQERLAAASLGANAIADKKKLIADSLDLVTSIPDDIEARIQELVGLLENGEQDSDIKRWREKLSVVAGLTSRLSPIESGTPTPDQRLAARTDLEAYIGKVGADDVKAQRWSSKLKALDAEEARLRQECVKLDTIALRKGDRDRYVPLLASLGELVPKNDPQLAKWNARIADFDQRLAALRAKIEPLTADEQVTVAERTQFLPVLSDLRAYLDENDRDLLAWSAKLEGASERVRKLGKDISDAVGAQPDMIPKPKQDQVAAKLANYEALAGSEDPQLKDWKDAIAAADRAITGGRKRLADFVTESGDGILPQGIHTVFESELGQLAALVYQGDADVLKWEQVLRDSRRTIDELRQDCRALEPTSPEPISLHAQRELAAKIERLIGKGGIEVARAEAYRKRLGDEAKRVEALRRELAIFDQPESITTAMSVGLDRLGKDAGLDDPDVARWSAKRTRVLALEDKLGALDRREGVPEDVEQLFAELAKAVGEKDPKLVTWQGKVARIAEAKAGLRVLDQRITFSASDVSQRLSVLVELVGASDRQWLRWKAKADEVGALKAALAGNESVISQTPSANEDSHAKLRRLIELVGTDDSDVRQAARRQDELDGPPKPAWAAEMGRDEYGLWADAVLPGGTQRLRYLASGVSTVGSRDGEPGRESDELPVRLRLAQGFWLAETELSRSIYKAAMGDDPSRSKAVDPAQQPVERVTWIEAGACCEALAKRVPSFAARLPMESEWEYACRAGSSAPWNLPSDAISEREVAKVAWYATNAASGPRPSRGRLPNRLGFFDMHGNLAEWCADAYAPYPTAETTISAPATGGDRRVLRGGSWGDEWTKTRAANRIPARPDLASAYAGMRLAVTVDWTARTPDGAQVIARAQQGTGAQTVEFGLGGWRVKLEREGTTK